MQTLIGKLRNAGIDTSEIAKVLKESEHKSDLHCMVYNALVNPSSSSCPWPEKCVHNQEDRP